MNCSRMPTASCFASSPETVFFELRYLCALNLRSRFAPRLFQVCLSSYSRMARFGPMISLRGGRLIPRSGDHGNPQLLIWKPRPARPGLLLLEIKPRLGVDDRGSFDIFQEIANVQGNGDCCIDAVRHDGVGSARDAADGCHWTNFTRLFTY